MEGRRRGLSRNFPYPMFVFKQSLPFLPPPITHTEENDFQWLFDSVVHYLLRSSLPSGRFRGRTKLLKRWTQMNAFIDFPPTEKTGQEIKSLTPLISGLCLLPTTE